MLAAPKKRTPKHVRALILAPTRELAAQIDENLKAYAANTTLKTALVFGGVGINPQIQALSRGVDFLVATPGRLLDHLGQKTVSLEDVEFLVLDEADRMLDMGFIHDIRRLLKLIPEKRQTLLFSATFSDEIRELADSFLKDPVNIEIARNKEAAIIEQEAYTIAKKRKRELLRDLIVDNQWEQVLVFTRMKHTANRLAQQLEKDPGHAVSLVSPDEKDYLRGIERLLKKKIATQAAAGYEGDVPEDIARDNAEQDKKRAEELRKMREARRAARQKQENARTAPRKNEAKVETTDNVAERFTKKVVRRPAAATLSDKAPRRTPRSSGDRPQTSERRFDRRREDERNERREDRRFADHRSEERRPRRAFGEDAAEGNRFRRRDDSRTEQARGARRFEERRRRPDIVSTLVHDDDRRYRRQEPKRDDSRFESVSSNLPPGMVLKFRRR